MPSGTANTQPKRRRSPLLLAALVAVPLLALTAGGVAGFSAWRRAKEEQALKVRALVKDLNHWQTTYEVAVERSDRETLDRLIEQAPGLRARRLELQDKGLTKSDTLNADFVEWQAATELARRNDDRKALERLLNQGATLETRWKELRAQTP